MCGVFGVRAPGRDVARLSYFGLYALQHRGQESAGIAVSEDGRLTVLRDLGLVPQGFEELRAAVGKTLASSSDSEVIGALIADDPRPLEDAVAHALRELAGAATVVG